MTIAADAFRRRDTAEFTRWTTCLLIVIALHCAALLLILRHRVPFQPVGAPPAAVIIDLAPAPPAPSEAAPPAEPTPPQPEQLVLPEPAPAPAVEPSPTPHPAVVLPLPQPPKPKPKAKPVERPPVQQREPAVVPAPVAAPPAPSPAPASPASSTVNVRATWQAQLLAWLERHKRYPRVAQEQHQQGLASPRCALDRQGRVLSFRLDKSSGFTLLDDEVLELIQRAQPVPAPPPEILGDRIEVAVPVAFMLKRGGL